MHGLIILCLWRSDIYLLCRVWNKLVSIGNNSNVCCIFVFVLFCSLLCYRICCASGLKKRHKRGSYASSSQEINVGEGRKGYRGDTSLKTQKENRSENRRTLLAVGPADHSVGLGCMLGFIPPMQCVRADCCLNVCSIIAAPTSGQKNNTSFEDDRLVIICNFMKQSKNQARALDSVVSHHVCGTDPFTLDRLFKKQGKLAGMWSSSTGFCLAEMRWDGSKTPQFPSKDNDTYSDLFK